MGRQETGPHGNLNLVVATPNDDRGGPVAAYHLKLHLMTNLRFKHAHRSQEDMNTLLCPICLLSERLGTEPHGGLSHVVVALNDLYDNRGVPVVAPDVKLHIMANLHACLICGVGTELNMLVCLHGFMTSFLQSPHSNRLLPVNILHTGHDVGDMQLDSMLLKSAQPLGQHHACVNS